jgi:uncharacterized membrane protein YccC
VLIAGVCCALFGNVDRPGPVIFKFLIGSVIGLVISAAYAYAILPRVTTFEMLVAVMAPPMLLIGSFMARPNTTLMALGALLGFANTVGFNATYTPGFAAFVNGAIAQTVGTGFAVVTVGLFQTIGTDYSVGRLFRAGWRDVARRAEGRDRDESRWSGRMLDRIALLLPRLAMQRSGQPEIPLDALADMRVGVVVGRLREVEYDFPPEELSPIGAALSAVGYHFRRLDPARPVAPPGNLLAEIDSGVAAFAADPDLARRREGLVLMTSLRRNLFPHAPAYGAQLEVAV